MNTDPLVKSIIGFLDHLKDSEKEDNTTQVVVNNPIQIFPALLRIQDEINKILSSSDTGRIYTIYCECVELAVNPDNLDLELFGVRLCGSHHWEPFDLPKHQIIGIAASFACRYYTQVSYRAKLGPEIHKGWNHAELSPSQE